ncbi:hypothetical protein PRZ48_012739 [Zasmidium cellare]|uniref:DUF7918 domain-containing protein n=1 Tax=Zasmidium cellare TaxID=395010 RepID=A0ABR0E5Q5_ZASCE|nr:hypothetical protein PRZ48_012739 [Zasmidium cellare]
MAILKSLPGVEVTVEVDGEPLDEYEDKTSTDDFDTVTRYIEAPNDRDFEIIIVTSAGATRGAGLEYQIIVDGNVSEELVTTHDQCFNRDPHTWVSVGWPISSSSYRTYKFNRFSTCESLDHPKLCDWASLTWILQVESATKHQPHDINKLGCIEVHVYHLLSSTRSGGELEFEDVPSDVADLSEQSTKGKSLTHTIAFGETVDKGGGSYAVETEYMSDDPIASFKFFYRSREALKAELIIPRTPSPPPLEERGIETLGQNDIADLQKQLKAAKEKMEAMAKIKNEEQSDSPRPRKVARPSAEQEVIELD